MHILMEAEALKQAVFIKSFSNAFLFHVRTRYGQKIIQEEIKKHTFQKRFESSGTNKPLFFH